MSTSADTPATWSPERLARAAWSRLAEPTDKVASGLIADLGPQGALDRIAEDPSVGGGRFAPRWSSWCPATEEERARRLGIRVVVPGDDEWPEGADRLEHPPVCLWVRGPVNLREALASSVAVVGARSATGYGISVAGEWSHAMAGLGVTVVSGGAFGIDAAAHRGALAAGGTTVAFLAGGVDRLYPASNADLLTEVAGTGAVVSESAPGCAPHRGRFLTRNRLIAAFSTGTLVVEAGMRSGSLSTARWADLCSRPVAAVPGPVTSDRSIGTHQIVRDGVATLVTTPEEAVEDLSPVGSHLAPQRQGASTARDAVEPDLRWCWDVLGPRPSTATVVARAGGRSLGEAELALGMLGLAGQAERTGAGWVRSR
ncbi:DNA-processing protein DprA [Kytococcus sedentarius]|uniref:DNA-processing protein DprA n=1 Tax=Kytococcus sedentarius TaxID=1276 RepID=UPI0035BBCF95